MGRKVHPTGFRLGIIKDHSSRWYADGKEYTDLLAEDRLIRAKVARELDKAGVSKVEIQRAPKQEIGRAHV